MARIRRYTLPALVLSIVLLLLVAAVPAVPALQAAPPSPEQTVQDAWRRAQEVGRYDFTCDLVQTTYPAPAVANVGRGSEQSTLHMEGSTDLPARTLELRLWPSGSPDLGAGNAVEVRIAGDQAYGRAAGGEWQEVDDFSGSFAPAGDLLAYLAGGKEYQELGREVRNLPDGSQLSFTRYAFALNGPALAAYIRDQLERTLRESGELPAGMTLDASREYNGLSGTGEVWVDSAGLPLRLVVHAAFPEQADGERVEADIQTDLSFPQGGAATSAEKQPGLSAALNPAGGPYDWPYLAFLAGLATGTAALVVLLVGYRRQRWAQVAFVLFLLFCIVGVPVMQAEQTGVYLEKQAARQAVQEENAAQAQARQDDARRQVASSWDPQLNAETQLEVRQAAAGLPAGNSPVTGAQPGVVSWRAALEEVPNPNGDTDGDGLANMEEARLGTNPNNIDTDGDQLRDDLEVRGFDLGGKHWYSDPTNADTNNDGLLDTQECWTVPPTVLPSNQPCDRDSDGDGTPDLFDRDNDGDGVDDRVDLSPSSQATFTRESNGATSFQLQVNGVHRNAQGETVPVLVDLQLRPVNPDHLTYALNVLDWPSGDTNGQVQRVLTDTFATSELVGMTPQDIGADPSSANGDLRLVPMVEILIPYVAGHTRNLPVKAGWNGTITATTPLEEWLDTATLDSYGITARYADAEGAMAVYVPVHMVYDELGAAREALGARMIYWPDDPDDWGSTHQVRLVWALQMLTDFCTGVPDPPEGQDPGAWLQSQCAKEQYRQETLQIANVYPEEWVLTGLSVREDQGMEVAIAFEDPGYDTNRDVDNNLWAMTRGLDRTWIAARDTDEDRVRDVNVGEIRRRFDNGSNGGTTRQERWGLPITATRVLTYSLPYQDMIAAIPMTYTRQILQDYFTRNGQPLADHPTLLFIREERARTVNLDMGGQAVQWSSARLMADMSAVSLDTLAAMNWRPYRYRDGEWEPYPLEEYWDQLGLHLEQVFPPDPGDPAGDVARCETLLAQAYYMTLVQGTAAIVQGDGIIYSNQGAVASDQDLAEDVAAADGQGAAAIAIDALDVFSYLVYDVTGQAESYGTIAKGILSAISRNSSTEASELSQLGGLESLSVGLTAVKLVLCVGRLVAALTSDADLQVIDGVINAIAVVQRVVDLVSTIKQITEAAEKGAGLLENMAKVGGEISRTSVIAGIVGVIIVGLMTVGSFITEMVTGHTRFGSLEFNTAFALMVATIIASVIIFCISLIPIIGQIIAAVIWLIDAVVNLVCGLLPEDAQEGEAATWACQGVEGLLGQGLFYTIYQSTPMVNLEDENRLSLSVPTLQLGQPAAGVTSGSTFAVALQVTNTIDYPTTNERGKAYRTNVGAWAFSWQFSEQTLKSSTFDYGLGPVTQTVHASLQRGTMSAQWTSPDGKRPYSYAWDVATDGSSVPFGEPGINVTTSIYLAEGFAVPVQECWSLSGVVGLLSTCSVNTMTSTNNMDIGQHLFWDVFPTTLDEFYRLAPKDEGYALAWGQGGDLTFPRLKDADGDGLRGAADGGADPDDGAWDTDADGLADFYEVQKGLDPRAYDMDLDGLSDRQELLQGTNPRLADSDGDGLTDVEELAGWDFCYGTADDGTLLITHVTSDPSLADTDFDGLSDFRERTFHFNPRAPSDPNVLDFSSQVQEDVSGVYTPTDGYVLPGASLRYSATVENNLFLDYAQGLLSTAFPPTISGQMAPTTFMLPPAGAKTLTGDLEVSAGASSGPVELPQVAGAEITDPYADALYNPDLLLHLEDAATATVFLDGSGSYPPNNGRCSEPGCPQRQAEGYIGRGIQFDGVDDVVQANVRVGVSTALWFKTTQANAIIAWYEGSRTGIMLVDGRLCGQFQAKAEQPGGNPSDYLTCSRGGDRYNDGRWHHVVYSWGDGVQLLYADGLCWGWSDKLPSDAQNAREPAVLDLGWDNGEYGQIPRFAGSLDDVSVYDHFLAEQEVKDLFGRPVLLLHLDESSLVRQGNYAGFADSSGFGLDATCTAAGSNRIDCPTPGQPSYARRSAMFYGNDRIYATGNALTMRDHYSQAFWVKPMNNSSRPVTDSYRQGILGNNLDEIAYPYVLREGTSLVVGFGTGTQRVERTFGNVLSIGTWSYVVVTYGTFDEDNNGADDHGRFSLYVNGIPRGEQVIEGALKPASPGSSSSWYNQVGIGEVSTCGTIYYQGLYSLDDTDETASDEFEVEYHSPGGIVEWSAYHGDVDKDEFFSADQSATYCTGMGPAKIQLWEDDGAGHDKDEDMGTFTVDHTFVSWEDTGQDRTSAMGWVMQFSAYGGQIALKTRNVNPSIPFYGGIDEVAIYNRALSSYDVEELFRSQSRSLYLPMDDAPGSYRLANATGREPATCPSNLAGCPTTGVAGRVGQAGLFQSSKSGRLSTQASLAQSSSSAAGATLMAWVYPTSASAGRHQVITSDNGGYDWSLLREGDTWYVFNGAASINTGATVDLNRWQHIAAVFDPGNGRVQFYKDGVQVGSNMAIGYDSSSRELSIGGHPTAGQYFDGRIDEVQVYNQPLDATAIQAAYNEAPQLMLHLDEELGATAFVDDSGNGNGGSCSQVESCSTITFTQIVCNAQHDGWGEDPDGEFYFQLDGQQIWYGDDMYAGQARPIYRSANVCPGGQIHMWEDDRWSADDDLGQFAVTVAPGSYNHTFIADGDVVTLYWQVGTGQFAVGSCPTAGTKGQVGLSPEFRGDDAVQTTMRVDEGSGSPGATMMAWVYPTGGSAGRHQVVSSDNGGYDWSLLREGGNWYVYTGAGSRNTGAAVQVGYWQHVAAVFDPAHGQARFYLNGTLVTDTLDIGYDSSTGSTALGFNPGSGNQYFDGRIDEVQLYRRPLSTGEIEAIYRYQGRWVEERQSHQIVVDDDFPTSVLVSDEPYRANHDAYLQISTQDPTSPVARAEWQVNGGDWIAAPACMDIVQGTAYCPLFDPQALGGEGVYTLQTRAIDSVGHVEAPTQSYTLYVDGTAPAVSTDIPDGTFLAPQPHPTEPNTWVVPLHGAVADPPIGAVPGSGVKEVWVTLPDSGGGRQRATLQGGGWTIDYLLEGAAPTGAYTMQVEAVDLVENIGSADLVTLLLDSTAPGAFATGPAQGGALLALLLDEPAGATSFADASGNGHDTACSGSACPQAGQAGRYDLAVQFDGTDDLLAPGGALDFARGDYTLAAWFQSSAATEQTILGAAGASGQLRLYLQPDGRPAFLENAQAPGSTLVSARAYNDGAWHHAAALKQGNTLWLYVDGEIVATGSTTGAFAQALDLAVGHLAGQAGDYFNGTIDEVRIYPLALSRSAVRGLVLYGPRQGRLDGIVSELAPDPDALLELRLDEPAGATAFADSSDYANDGACSGASCPASTAGKYGGAYSFDGVDDYVTIPANSTLSGLVDNLTVMAWVRPDTLSGVHRIVAPARANSNNGIGFGTSGPGLRFTAFGVKDYNTANTTLSTDRWQHVAAVLKGGNVTFYLDGAARETITGTAAALPNGDDPPLVGMTTLSGSSTPIELFDGAIDEVRLFNRALGPDEVRLYAQQRVAGVNGLELAFTPDSPGSTLHNEALPQGTVLYLPLDAATGTPGGGEETQFADLSTNALLATCSGDSCPATGAAGHSRQALFFDGQDDWLALPDHPALDVATDLTLAAWVRRGPSGSWDVIYDSGSGADDWWFTISPYGWLYFEIGTTARYRSTRAIRDTSWHHVAVVKSGDSGTNLFIYLDAVPAGSFAAGTLATPSGLKRVGYTGREPADFAFDGLIDELVLLNRPLTADEVRALYLGSEAVLHLSFDQAWVGDRLQDASGWNNTVVLHGAAGQHIAAGQVGPGALALNGTSDYATVERSLDFARGGYSLAAWFRTDTAAWQTILAASDPATDLPGILIEVLADGRVHYLHRSPAGGSGGTEINSPLSYNDGLWHLAVAVQEGDRMALYVDGALVGNAIDASTFTLALNVTAGRLGRTTAQRYWNGALDDVRLYPRALDALEVQSLYDSRWRPVALDESGADVLRATWAYTVPAGLEGSYEVDLRGQDYFGNRNDSLDERGVWSGALDTLAPRLALSQTIYHAGSTYAVRYSYSAQDLNLAESGFHSPCAPAPDRTYFTAPWYRALVGANSTQLYSLSGSCQMDTVDRVGKLVGPGVLNDVDVQNDLAYTIGYYNSAGFLRVVNVAVPWNPQQIGWDTPMPNGGTTLYAAGQYLYVGENEMGTMGVIDASNPKNPVQVGVYHAPGPMLLGLYAQDNYVYVADNDMGLRVVDVSNPYIPVEVGHFTPTAQAQDVLVVGSTAYVADGPAGLAILDVSNPANPQQVGATETPGWATAVFVTGTLAYVAGGDGGLRVVDVSSPANPHEVGFYDTPGWAMDVHVVGRYAYVSDADGGVWVLNVANPAAPRLVGGYDTPGVAGGIEAIGAYAYVADGDGGLQVLVNRLDGDELGACDLFGNCSRTSPLDRLLLEPAGEVPITGTLIVEPISGTYLTGTTTITAGGGAYSPSSLRALTVTVDGGPVYTQTWTSPTVSETTWLVPWMPAGDGPHVIAASLLDWAGRLYGDAVTVTLDTVPPAVEFTTLVTGTNATAGQILLNGTAVDNLGVDSVAVRLNGGEWWPASLAGDRWTAPWSPDGAGPLDGVPYTLTARATDLAGWTTLLTNTVLVDVAGPVPVTMTLAYQDQGGVTHPITRTGATIYDVTPTLVLSWTAGSDGSGLSGYRAGWTAVDLEGVTETLAPYAPGDPRRNVYQPGEAQKLAANVYSLDAYGNTTWQRFGPIYVDSPLTPDYAGLLDPDGVYRGWMDGGCSLLGVDRKVNRAAGSRPSLSAEQRFYATWDEAALRLAWTGADWSGDGDLFVYLDTAPGGITVTLNPYTATITTTIYLPGNTPGLTGTAPMAVDYLVWVQDAAHADLWQWDGSAWITVTALTDTAYLFTPGLDEGQTDLYIPFSLLGIADPAAAGLDLVALAGEENALQLWATMPPANPVNSPRVARGAENDAATTFALTQRYHWDSLGAGLCPNGSRGTGVAPAPDADLELALSVEPAGTTYAFLGDHLFALWDLLFGGKAAGVSSFFTGRSTDHPLLSDRQVVTYTLHYENRGAAPATGVVAQVRSAYALVLPDGAPLPAPEHGYAQTVPIGVIAPGTAGSITFRGQVDLAWAQGAYQACLPSYPNTPEVCELYLRWAAADVEIVDDAHPAGAPLEWLWADHQVDYQPPLFYGVQQPEYLLAAITNTLSGYGFEDSGLPLLSVEVQGPAGSATLSCPDDTPADGAWSCPLNATAANGGVSPQDGDLFQVRLQGTDGAGQAGPWTNWQPFVVDTVPPTVTAAADGFTGTVGALWYRFQGRLYDNRGAAGVEVCLAEECHAADVSLAPAAAHSYEDRPDPPIPIDAGAACGSGAVVRTFSVTDSFSVGTVQLGLNAEHPDRDQLRAELTSPAGTTVRVLGDDLLVGTRFRDLDVLLYDAAGEGLHAFQGDDDPLGPFFDRRARPQAPFYAFRGEVAAGTWTLTLCDTDPVRDDGLYHLSRLVLTPLDTAPRSGSWWYTQSFSETADGVTQTVSIYGVDLVGNRSAPPLTFSFLLDNVPPAVTVTGVLANLNYARAFTPTPVLTGTVHDGGGVDLMYALVQDPEGKLTRERVARVGSDWFFPFKPALVGRHLIWITAEDRAGNGTRVGPYVLDVAPPTMLYLPAVLKEPPAPPAGQFQIYLPLLLRGWRSAAPEVPVAGLSAAGSSPTVLGQATTLTATTVAGTNVVYTWAFGDGAMGSGEIVTHTYPLTGSYTVVVTAGNSVSVATATATVRVVPTEEPIAGLAVTNSGPTPLGDATTFTVTIAAGSNVAYDQDFGDGAVPCTVTRSPAGVRLVYHLYPAAGVYTAVFTASNSVSVMTVTTTVMVDGDTVTSMAGGSNLPPRASFAGEPPLPWPQTQRPGKRGTVREGS